MCFYYEYSFCRCSRYETEIRRLRILKPVRVCQACFNILRAQQAADAVSQNKVWPLEVNASEVMT